MPEKAFESLSDQLTRSLIGADFKGYCALIELPLSVVTHGGGSYTLHSEAELRKDFDAYVQALKAYGVTDIYRQILSRDSAAPQGAVVCCLIHIMAKARRIVDPFEARFHLQLSPQGWRFHRIESSGGHLAWSLGLTAITSQGSFPPNGGSLIADS